MIFFKNFFLLEKNKKEKKRFAYLRLVHISRTRTESSINVWEGTNRFFHWARCVSINSKRIKTRVMVVFLWKIWIVNDWNLKKILCMEINCLINESSWVLFSKLWDVFMRKLTEEFWVALLKFCAHLTAIYFDGFLGTSQNCVF